MRVLSTATRFEDSNAKEEYFCVSTVGLPLGSELCMNYGANKGEHSDARPVRILHPGQYGAGQWVPYLNIWYCRFSPSYKVLPLFLPHEYIQNIPDFASQTIRSRPVSTVSQYMILPFFVFIYWCRQRFDFILVLPHKYIQNNPSVVLYCPLIISTRCPKNTW